MKLELVRDYTGPDCTLGSLFVSGVKFDTIERPWLPDDLCPAGRKGVSCIPVGTYRLVRHDTEAHPKSFAIVNQEMAVYHYPEEAPMGSELRVRTAVLIHAANWASELRGCIALGMKRHFSGTAWMVQNSRLAMKAFHDLVPWTNDHEIVISTGFNYG